MNNLVVEAWPINRLRPYEKNPRKNDPAVPKMIRAIEEFGFRIPVVARSDGMIVDGHLRYKAAVKMGMDTVPVALADGLTEDQIKAFRLLANKSASWAEWETDLLLGELGELSENGFDLTLTGFDDAELAKLLGTSSAEGLTDPDDTPSVPVHPVTVPGDIWLLGKHRLMCGDSTNPQHIERLMAGAQADICFTSPPYGQQRDYKSGGISDWDALMQGVFGILPVKQDAQVLVNLGLIHRDGEWMPYWDGWIEFMRAAGWKRFGWYVWDQGPGLSGDWHGRLAPSHEFIFHFNREAERARKTKASKMAGSMSAGLMRDADGGFSGGRASKGAQPIQDTKIPDSVVRVMRHKGGLGKAGSHPAVFPVALPAEMLTAFSDPGDIAFEPFTGSGSQIIAAHINDRICYGMELAESYVDVAVRRWQLFTGQEATLESDGRSFSEVMEARPVRESAAS